MAEKISITLDLCDVAFIADCRDAYLNSQADEVAGFQVVLRDDYFIACKWLFERVNKFTGAIEIWEHSEAQHASIDTYKEDYYKNWTLDHQ